MLIVCAVDRSLFGSRLSASKAALAAVFTTSGSTTARVIARPGVSECRTIHRPYFVPAVSAERLQEPPVESVIDVPIVRRLVRIGHDPVVTTSLAYL